MIDDWKGCGIKAVNGSLRTNTLVIFSPIYFLDLWTGGEPFNKALQKAYSMEIEKIRSFEAISSIISLLTTEEILEDSRQLIGGTDSTLSWKEFDVGSGT